MSRSDGSVASVRRRVGIVGLLALTGLVVVPVGGHVAAVHDEAFELDGNVDDAEPPGAPAPEVDWDNDIVGVGGNGFSIAQTSLPAGFVQATAGPDFTTTIKQGQEVAAAPDDT